MSEQHQFYFDQTTGRYCVRCRHCDGLWRLKDEWQFLMLAGRAVVPGLLLIIALLLRLQGKVAFIIFGCLYLCVCFLFRPFICWYMNRTGKYKVFLFDAQPTDHFD